MQFARCSMGNEGNSFRTSQRMLKRWTTKIAFPHMAGVFYGLFVFTLWARQSADQLCHAILLLLILPPLRVAKYLQQYFIDLSDRRWVYPAAWMDRWVKAFSTLQFCIIFMFLLFVLCLLLLCLTWPSSVCNWIFLFAKIDISSETSKSTLGQSGGGQ